MAGSSPVFCTSVVRTCAARSTGWTPDRPPFRFPTGVRTASTMTASRLKSISSFCMANFVVGALFNSWIQRDDFAFRPRYADHHGLVQRALLGAEHRIAMVGNSVDDGCFACSADTPFTAADDVHSVFVAQDFEYRFVPGNGGPHATVIQDHVKRNVHLSVPLQHPGSEESLKVKALGRPHAASLLDRADQARRAAAADEGPRLGSAPDGGPVP